MTKQEEIREGIDRDIEFVLMAAYHAGKTGESISEAIDKCKSHLKKALHSQGVVIKVERELPENNYINWSLAPDELKPRTTRQVLHLRYWAYDMAQKDMLRDGYEVTIPLIEE